MDKISKKKVEQLKKQKEEEKKIAFENYKRQLDEDYVDLHSNEFMAFYEYFRDLVGERLGYRIDGHYGEFVNFLVNNSSHKDEFRETKIQEYLEESSEDEEEEEEEVGKYDFLYFKGGY